MPLNDITWSTGKQNMGGLRDSIYVVPATDVDLSVAPTLAPDGKTITSNIALVANAKFYRLYFTKGTGKMDFGVVGERDGKSFENMAEFNVPGTDAANLSVLDEMLNGAFVAIVKDSGQQYIMGLSQDDNGVIHADLPVYTEAMAGTTGQASADKKGMTVTLKSESPHTPFVYSGTIDLDDLT